MRTTGRDVIEHIEHVITTTRAELEATVDRHDAAVAMRELFYAAVDDTDCPADQAIAAMTPDPVSRARVANLNDRMTPKKEHHP